MTIDQSKVQAVTAENEEQDTLSNKKYIEIQNCYFFLWDVFWSSVLKQVYFEADIDKLLYCNEVHFFDKVTGMRVWNFTKTSIGKYFLKKVFFQGFHSDLLLPIKIS